MAQTIDNYIPVFKSRKTGKRVPIWHTLRMYSYISSVMYDLDFYATTKRRWDIYASYGSLMAQRVYLSHFEYGIQQLTGEESSRSIFASVKISPTLDKRYNRATLHESEHTSLWFHYDKGKFTDDKNILLLAYYDFDHIYDCHSVIETGRKINGLTPQIASKRLDFFNILYGGHDPLHTIDDYDIVFPQEKKKRKSKSNHYVYTLSHPITKDIIYVGYTTNPSMRYQSHIYSQTNPHLIKIMMTTEERPSMDIIYKSDTYEDAYNYENKMILEYGKQYKLANIAKNPLSARPDSDIPF